MNPTLKQILISLGVVGVFLVGVFTLKVPTENVLGGGSSGQETVIRGLINDGFSNMSAASTNTIPTFNFPFGELGHRYASFQFSSLGNVTGRIYASNDSPYASSTNLNTWSDITNDLIGASTFTSNRFIFIDSKIITGRLRITLTTSTNSSTWSIRAAFA